MTHAVHVFHNSVQPVAMFRSVKQAEAFITRMQGKGFGGMSFELVQVSLRQNEWVADGYR